VNERGSVREKIDVTLSVPRLQILTIEDVLGGKKMDMPAQQEIRSFKQAPKAKGKKVDEAKRF